MFHCLPYGNSFTIFFYFYFYFKDFIYQPQLIIDHNTFQVQQAEHHQLFLCFNKKKDKLETYSSGLIETILTYYYFNKIININTLTTYTVLSSSVEFHESRILSTVSQSVFLVCFIYIKNSP